MTMDNDENESIKSVDTTTNTLCLSESMVLTLNSMKMKLINLLNHQFVQQQMHSTTNIQTIFNNSNKLPANHNNSNKRFETNKRRVVDFSALGKMLTQMRLMHTQIVNERLPDFGHQQQRNDGLCV